MKTFVGTSAKALETQIWTALIAMLLVKILHLTSAFGWHLSNFMVLLRQQLFVYRGLWKWINDPFQAPETPPTQQWNWSSLDLDSRSSRQGLQHTTTGPFRSTSWTANCSMHNFEPTNPFRQTTATPPYALSYQRPTKTIPDILDSSECLFKILLVRRVTAYKAC